ncbi:intracellular sulfur oxidation DsrE/DsrF family protein [Bradyrhizobium sp. LM2.7]
MTRSQKFGAMMLTLLAWTAIAPASAQQVPLQDKPFAEHKVVLQLSDGDAKKQALVLSIANNLLKAYDPDKVAIEIVAFGPGIDLLLAGNDRRKQVESLIAQGVRFDICLNTVDTIERESGKRPEFIPAASAGAGRGRADPFPGGEWLHAGEAVGRSLAPSSRRRPGPIPRDLSMEGGQRTERRVLAKLLPMAMGPGLRRDDIEFGGTAGARHPATKIF